MAGGEPARRPFAAVCAWVGWRDTPPGTHTHTHTSSYAQLASPAQHGPPALPALAAASLLAVRAQRCLSLPLPAAPAHSLVPPQLAAPAPPCPASSAPK